MNSSKFETNSESEPQRPSVVQPDAFDDNHKPDTHGDHTGDINGPEDPGHDDGPDTHGDDPGNDNGPEQSSSPPPSMSDYDRADLPRPQLAPPPEVWATKHRMFHAFLCSLGHRLTKPVRLAYTSHDYTTGAPGSEHLRFHCRCEKPGEQASGYYYSNLHTGDPNYVVVQYGCAHDSRYATWDSCDALKADYEARRLEEIKQLQPRPAAQSLASTFPPGLLGELCELYMRTAVKPVREFAVVAALAVISALAGRAYRIRWNLKLSLYLLLTAPTGTGKEGVKNFVVAVLELLARMHPELDVMLGRFASGAAITSTMAAEIVGLSFYGEAGYFLRQICHPAASGNDLALYAQLLDLYSATSWQSSKNYAKPKDNVPRVYDPTLTFVCEGTESSVWGPMNESHVGSGLLPRFLCFHSDAEPQMCRQYVPMELPAGLLSALSGLAKWHLEQKGDQGKDPAKAPRQVQETPDAKEFMDAFDRHTVDELRAEGTDESVKRQMLTRENEQFLKLCGLLAAFTNPAQPVVTLEMAKWAAAVAKENTRRMVDRFDAGKFGCGEAQQERVVRAAMAKFKASRPAQRRDSNCPQIWIEQGDLVPYAYLKKLCGRDKAFADAKVGPERALQGALRSLTKSGILGQIIVEKPSLRDSGGTAIGYRDEALPFYFPGVNWSALEDGSSSAIKAEEAYKRYKTTLEY